MMTTIVQDRLLERKLITFPLPFFCKTADSLSRISMDLIFGFGLWLSRQCRHSARTLTWKQTFLGILKSMCKNLLPYPMMETDTIVGDPPDGTYTCLLQLLSLQSCVLSQTHTFISRLNWDVRLKNGAAGMQTHALFLKTHVLLKNANTFHQIFQFLQFLTGQLVLGKWSWIPCGVTVFQVYRETCFFL